MLYLEDYLEMIEHLPQELRDRFTEMRELDLTVQNSMDVLEKKQRAFFLQCKRGELPEEGIEEEFQNLRKEYYKVMEDAEEKVNISTQSHDLVERYLRRLDSELFKFKCELEADNNGITEILEKRSLEMDNNTSSAATALINVMNMNQKENRYYNTGSIASSNANQSGALAGSVSSSVLGGGASNSMSSISLPATPTSNKERYRIPKVEKRRDSNVPNAVPVVPEKRANLGTNITTPATAVPVMRPITPNVVPHGVLSVNTVNNSAAVAAATPTAVAAGVATPSAVAAAYNLPQIGGAASIAAAASQAIVATQQMQQGRRTASLKASYEAIHGSGGPTEFWISRDITGAAAAAAAPTQQSTLVTASGGERKHKKKSTTNMTHSNAVAPNPSTPSTTLSSLASSSSSVSVDSLDMLPTSASVAASATAVNVGGSGVSSIALSNSPSTSTQAANRAATANTIAAANAVTTSTNIGAGVSDTSSSLVTEQANDADWSYDPNEPRYCTCNQVSYGDMVACDNDACPYEWFHYPCVGITQPPKGKWYCPKCTASMRRRGNRKN